MPWTKNIFPNSMKNLPAAVRNKAIEIGNALLEEKNMGEGILIATAISRAKDWAVNHGKKAEIKGAGRRTDIKHHGKDRYVIPGKEGKWGVKEEGKERPESIFTSKKSAVKKATLEAKKDNASVTIQKRTGKIEKRVSYNPNRKASKQK